MEGSKLINLLKSFSKKEWNRLELFLSSPYYNRKESVLALFLLLKKTAPEFNTRRIEKERVFKKLYPKKKYKDLEMRLLMSQLVQLIEAFWVQEQFQSKPLSKEQLLLECVADRNLEKYFQQQLTTFGKQLEQYPKRGRDYFRSQYLLREQAYQQAIFSQNRPVDTSLQSALDYFERYYLVVKLQYCCAALNRQNIVSVEYDLFLLEETLAIIETSKFKDEILIAAYYHALHILLDRSAAHHFQLLSQLLDTTTNRQQLPNHDLRQLYYLLVNYCIRQVKTGALNSYTALFDIYKAMLEEGVILTGDYLGANHYTNINKTALALKKYAWAKTFMEKYKEHLLPRQKRTIFHYNAALFHFAQAEYDQARDHMLDIDLDSPIAHISYKKLLAQVYYELSETAPFLSLIGNFRVQLKRNQQMSESNKTAFRHFINFIAHLYRLKEGRKKSLKTLEASIIQETPVLDKKWLLEKVLELHYHQTCYETFSPRLYVRINKRHTSLDRFLQSQKASTWAFITAYNPQSEKCREEENVQAQANLVKRLQEMGKAFWEGQGIGDEGDWPPEPSLLILDIDRAESVQLGQEFGQKAIVYGEWRKKAELVFC